MLFEQGDDRLAVRLRDPRQAERLELGQELGGTGVVRDQSVAVAKDGGSSGEQLTQRVGDGRGRGHAPLQISDISFISRGFSRESGRIKITLKLSLRSECSGATRPDPLLMKLISLISIADMDRPSLRQHDKVVIGEDAKDRLEAKLRS